MTVGQTSEQKDDESDRRNGENTKRMLRQLLQGGQHRHGERYCTVGNIAVNGSEVVGNIG